MPPALAITFGGGSAGGPPGGLVVLLVLVVALVVSVGIGLALRLRDRRRGPGRDHVEERMPAPPESPVFGGDWGRGDPRPLRGPSTRSDWLVVAAVAAGVLVLAVATLV